MATAPLRVLPTPEALGEALADRILQRIEEARVAGQPFVLGSPTGRTPRPPMRRRTNPGHAATSRGSRSLRRSRRFYCRSTGSTTRGSGSRGLPSLMPTTTRSPTPAGSTSFSWHRARATGTSPSTHPGARETVAPVSSRSPRRRGATICRHSRPSGRWIACLPMESASASRRSWRRVRR
jgi:hypothetical protein